MRSLKHKTIFAFLFSFIPLHLSAETIQLNPAAEKVISERAKLEAAGDAAAVETILLDMGFDPKDVDEAKAAEALLAQLQQLRQNLKYELIGNAQFNAYKQMVIKLRNEFHTSDHEFRALMRPLRLELYEFAKGKLPEKDRKLELAALAQNLKRLREFHHRVRSGDFSSAETAKMQLVHMMRPVLHQSLLLNSLIAHDINPDVLPAERHAGICAWIVKGAFMAFLAATTVGYFGFESEAMSMENALTLSGGTGAAGFLGLVMNLLSQHRMTKMQKEKQNEIHRALNKKPDMQTLTDMLRGIEVENAEQLAKLSETPGGLMAYAHLILKDIAKNSEVTCPVLTGANG